MSSFIKRSKPRKIAVDDEEEGDDGQLQGPKFTKPAFKRSTLRKSINADTSSTIPRQEEDDEDSGPTVIRPSVSRSSSLKKKSKNSAARLSFGPGEGDAPISTPRKSNLAHIALSNSARSLPFRRDEDSDRPKYSAEYLSELASSTPNTPARSSSGDLDEDLTFSAAELEGATIVDDAIPPIPPRPRSKQPSPALPATTAPSSAPRIMTEAEMQARRELRGQLAAQGTFYPFDNKMEGEHTEEQDYIPLGEEEDEKEQRRQELGRSHFSRHAKDDGDADFYEGFDSFVEDGGISLGKKAEKEARRRHRAEMAELIAEAEQEDDGEDDSEGERIAAFEDAQTRAGMEGLSLREKEKAMKDRLASSRGKAEVPGKITPLPDLSECMQRLQDKVAAMRQDIRRREQEMAALEKENAEIENREKEVQQLLNQAGEKFQALMKEKGTGSVAVSGLGVGMSTGTPGSNTPLRAIPPGVMGMMGGTQVERGLESFGNTPVRQQRDGDGDIAMDED